MSKRIYIYSANPIPYQVDDIVIKGGAGVTNFKTLETPYGVVTEVTENQLERLRQDRLFNKYVKNCVFTVSNIKEDADEVAKGELVDATESKAASLKPRKKEVIKAED